MTTSYALAAAISLLGRLPVAAVAAQGPAGTAFVDVAVVPMDRERVLSHQTVVVQGDRIVAMGPVGKVAVPARAVRIDGRGKFLIPGMADMHTHIWMWLGLGVQDTMSAEAMVQGKQKLFRYLSDGVTTIRDMWGYLPTLDLKTQAASGAILSPRIYVSVRPGNEGLAHLSERPDSAVRLAQKAGFDLIKFWSAPGGAELDSILTTARRVGLPIAGHAPYEDNLRAPPMHYGSVEHLLGFWNKKAANAANDAQIRATAIALKQAGVWVCPTLYHIVRSFSYIDTATVYHALRVMRDVGVGLLAGTDAMWSSGYRVYHELEMLVKAGLTPYEALATATRNPAAYFGTLDSTGTVAVQKRADLVLLVGNPLTDIRHTAQPVGVMLGGRWLPRAELDQILALLPDPGWKSSQPR